MEPFFALRSVLFCFVLIDYITIMVNSEIDNSMPVVPPFYCILDGLLMLDKKNINESVNTAFVN